MMPSTPGVTSVEVHGFVGWVASAVAFVVYLLWAVIPDSVLRAHGVTYYPSKYWAVAVPTWVCISVVALYWSYESLNIALLGGLDTPGKTLDLRYEESLRTLGSTEASQGGYFGAPGSRNILPLRVIPQGVVDLVFIEGLSPHEAEAEYRAKVRGRAKA